METQRKKGRAKQVTFASVLSAVVLWSGWEYVPWKSIFHHENDKGGASPIAALNKAPVQQGNGNAQAVGNGQAAAGNGNQQASGKDVTEVSLQNVTGDGNGSFNKVEKNTYNIVERDTIRGTQTTHKELEDAFPFGYVVVRLADAHWTYEPDQSLITVKFDWSKIKVVPNAANHTVSWNIPDFDLEWPSGQQVTGNSIYDLIIPMTTNVFSAGIRTPGEPEMMFTTLNDNQLHPVFVLGFRIDRSARGNGPGKP
jgi:hypothetical protein